MLTPRVEALERGMGEIRLILERIEKKQDEFSMDLTDLRRDLGELRKEQTDQGKSLARLDGRVSNLPTTMQLILFVLAVMAFGVGRQFFGV